MSRKGENIYKRKDGRWEGRFLESYNPDGKGRYHSVYAASYTEVREKLKSYKTMTIKNPVRSSKLAKYCAEWLGMVKLNHKESTYCKYRNICENHILPVFAGLNISLISVELIENFLADRLNNHKFSSKTVKDILCVLKQIFAFAEESGANVICNFDHIHIRQKKNKMRVLSSDEQKILSDYLLKDMALDKLGIYLSLYTGIRIGELCALKWKNIQFNKQILKIDKTMQRIQTFDSNEKTKVIISEPKSLCSLREIPLPKFLCDILRSFKSSDNCFLLSGDSDRFVEPRALSYNFKKYVEKYGLKDVNFHALRHTFATRCVESGFDIKTLSEILGHSSVKITLDRYVHSSMELKRKNMEKLAEIF